MLCVNLWLVCNPAMHWINSKIRIHRPLVHSINTHVNGNVLHIIKTIYLHILNRIIHPQEPPNCISRSQVLVWQNVFSVTWRTEDSISQTVFSCITYYIIIFSGFPSNHCMNFINPLELVSQYKLGFLSIEKNKIESSFLRCFRA